MELTEPQVWTMIGVFAAVMIGAITVLVRQNENIISSFRRELGARFDAIDEKFTATNEKFTTRFDAMDEKIETRLGSIDRRLEDLDKEVANLATRFWKSS